MAETRSFYFPSAAHHSQSTWKPSVDIYRCEHGWLVKCDLAGVRRKDIQTTIQGPRLTISGIRRDWTVVEGHRAYSLEITYDRFERMIEMPCDIERAEMEIDYRDGMLLVAIRTECD
jgi:HSP20 family molecular chaperone IbpA